MRLFAPTNDQPHYIALLDIGSASVTGSVAYSAPDGALEILWSTQERILLKQITNQAETGRRIMSAFMNVVLELGQSGGQAVRDHYPRGSIDTTQVSIAAPWSYTITKNVQYEKEQSFKVSEHLVEQLLSTMKEKIQRELQEHEVADHLGLRVVSRSVTNMQANGYNIDAAHDQTATAVRMSLSNTVIQNYLHEMIVDAHNKVLPKSSLQIVSFVLMLYYVMRYTHSEMQEYCIINQTLEATELGVVRNGILCYSTHEPYGMVTLSRDLATALAIPIEEMYGIIQSNQWEYRYRELATDTQAEVDSILEKYQETIANLLRQTGDSFTIPKSIYMHTLSCTYDFIGPHIELGAAAASGMAHIIHNLDEELVSIAAGFGDGRAAHSCVELVSAVYFHTHKNNPSLISS